MKKIRGFKLVLLGLIIYTPLFLYNTYIDFNVPTWVFVVVGIPAGTCALIGLFQMHRKRQDELDDTLKSSLDDKKNNRY